MGAPGVGKSGKKGDKSNGTRRAFGSHRFHYLFLALAVRLLTNRFITTYIASSPTLTSSRRLKFPSPSSSPPPPAPSASSSSSSLGQQQQQLHLIVRDVSSGEKNLESHLSWAQCLVVACARSNPSSLDFAGAALERRAVFRPDMPAVLVANKADLLQGGGLSSEGTTSSLEECHELALRHGCLFFELSAMESPVGTRLVLMALLSELLKGSQQQQGKRGSCPPPPASARAKMTSRRLWMKVFGALCKSLCTPPTPAATTAEKR